MIYLIESYGILEGFFNVQNILEMSMSALRALHGIFFFVSFNCFPRCFQQAPAVLEISRQRAFLIETRFCIVYFESSISILIYAYSSVILLVHRGHFYSGE